MRVRMYVRAYARAYECGQIVIRTHDHDQHTTGTGPPDTPTEHKTTGKAEKPAYVGIIAGNEKKYKKVKKNLEIRKKSVPLCSKSKSKQYEEEERLERIRKMNRLDHEKRNK